MPAWRKGGAAAKLPRKCQKARDLDSFPPRLFSTD